MDFSDIKYGYCQAQGDLTSAPLLAQEHTLVASKGGISVQYTMIIKPGMQERGGILNSHQMTSAPRLQLLLACGRPCAFCFRAEPPQAGNLLPIGLILNYEVLSLVLGKISCMAP
eukprot:1158856-Pelagomonas_calceolata.AAC.9